LSSYTAGGKKKDGKTARDGKAFPVPYNTYAMGERREDFGGGERVDKCDVGRE